MSLDRWLRIYINACYYGERCRLNSTLRSNACSYGVRRSVIYTMLLCRASYDQGVNFREGVAFAGLIFSQGWIGSINRVHPKLTIRSTAGRRQAWHACMHARHGLTSLSATYVRRTDTSRSQRKTNVGARRRVKHPAGRTGASRVHLRTQQSCRANTARPNQRT